MSIRTGPERCARAVESSPPTRPCLDERRVEDGQAGRHVVAVQGDAVSLEDRRRRCMAHASLRRTECVFQWRSASGALPRSALGARSFHARPGRTGSERSCPPSSPSGCAGANGTFTYSEPVCQVPIAPRTYGPATTLSTSLPNTLSETAREHRIYDLTLGCQDGFWRSHRIILAAFPVVLQPAGDCVFSGGISR